MLQNGREKLRDSEKIEARTQEKDKSGSRKKSKKKTLTNSGVRTHTFTLNPRISLGFFLFLTSGEHLSIDAC